MKLRRFAPKINYNRDFADKSSNFHSRLLKRFHFFNNLLEGQYQDQERDEKTRSDGKENVVEIRGRQRF